MKLKWSMITALLSILLVLSACNSKELNADKEPETEPNTNAPEKESADTEINDADKDEPNDEQQEELSNLEDETVDTPEDEGIQDVDAEVVKSDNQDYQMLLLSHYVLTGEEPGKDVVYPAEDDSNYMRIETMEAEEGTYDYLLENMLTILEASSNGATPVEQTDTDTLPKGDVLKNVKVFSVKSDNSPVTGIIFEREGLVVRLTIFDSENADYYNDFIRMAESITK